MKVAVIYGGISSEREVSLKSGKSMVENLKKDKYDVLDFKIDNKTDVFNLDKDVDLVILGLHGKFGEDGCIQSILDAMDIKYCGCSPLTSGILMDKNFTKTIARQNDILTADWLTVKSVDEINYDDIDRLGYPVFIKPNSGGSSVATFFVKNKEDVENAVREGLKYDEIVMIEKYIKGVEYTSFVLNGEIYPTIKITSEQEFFNYEAKYSTTNGAKYIVVELPKELDEKVLSTSSKCWNAYNCKGYVRVDYIITDDGDVYLLELNTLPGMTETSLIPKSAAARGISYSDLLDKLIETSM
ncbi:D-alanine--D-alanine ligase [Peptostreptococcus porci]|uniref:D-alanine--D-alanine ligase n=1 Tax=Peptostreptococcus porci TaxID=2652282 RepID=UPI0023F48AF9|nr:D-alanine--D-alanine ligase [Peptostreptococcus porci]MDD7182370.1 D-alanine--D-alanine ligase [Peptostreptococcus porci]MDY4128606.1 D-alanine--D-alanine ligase [Peptostreptococcus porci]MDY5965015.1 D-alanine--D-alanine ligase [Peptostreptococcus porci]